MTTMLNNSVRISIEFENRIVSLQAVTQEQTWGELLELFLDLLPSLGYVIPSQAREDILNASEPPFREMI